MNNEKLFNDGTGKNEDIENNNDNLSKIIYITQIKEKICDKRLHYFYTKNIKIFMKLVLLNI